MIDTTYETLYRIGDAVLGKCTRKPTVPKKPCYDEECVRLHGIHKDRWKEEKQLKLADLNATAATRMRKEAWNEYSTEVKYKKALYEKRC